MSDYGNDFTGDAGGQQQMNVMDVMNQLMIMRFAQNGNFACLKKCGIQIEGKLSSREEACMSRCLGMYVKTAEVVSTVIAEKSQRGGM